MLLAGQIAGFLNFNISEGIGGKKLFFLHAGVYQLKLQIDDVIKGSCCQPWPGRLLKLQDLKKLKEL